MTNTDHRCLSQFLCHTLSLFNYEEKSKLCEEMLKLMNSGDNFFYEYKKCSPFFTKINKELVKLYYVHESMWPMVKKNLIQLEQQVNSPRRSYRNLSSTLFNLGILINTIDNRRLMGVQCAHEGHIKIDTILIKRMLNFALNRLAKRVEALEFQISQLVFE